jgi:hypothetical protein
VSPQFHCTFDSNFETLKEYNLPESQWQEKAHFTEKREAAPTKKQGRLYRREDDRPIHAEKERETTIEEITNVQPDPQLQPEEEIEPPLQDQGHVSVDQPEPVRRSQRSRRPPTRLKDYVTDLKEIEALAAECKEPVPHEVLDIYHEDIVAHKSLVDPDTLYLWQARKEPDFPKFLEAMQKEIDAHTTGGHWRIVKRAEVPPGAAILPAVWSMKRKRRISDRTVYKWKARLNVDGSKQVQGVHYQETYSPVVSWSTTRFFLIQALMRKWHTKQIDYVLAYPQAPVERDLYMELPKGVRLEGITEEDQRDYVLQIVKNLYGQKQAGRVWYQYLTKGLEEIGFKKSKVDECVFYYKKSIMLVYVDDSIIMGPDANEIATLIKAIGKRFKIQEEGNICEYLGIEVKRDGAGYLTLRQPQLVDSILRDLNLGKGDVKARTTPALKTRVLHKDTQGEPFNEAFHYRSIIGKLNYLEKSTRPDISFAVHQCARFSSDPKKSHAMAVKYIGRYLASTRDKGIQIKPDNNGFECYVDASHAGDWKQEAAIDDPATARSRTGYVIRYAGYPVVWASKLQTEIALSVTEAEYIALSTAAREILPILSLAKEAANIGVIPKTQAPILRCKIFEDNNGAVEMANVPKMRPRTKHLNIKYHFFWQFVQQGILSVRHIAGEKQLAYVLTKALEFTTFARHRKEIMGW